MDIRRLLKASCPLARPLFGHPALTLTGSRSRQGNTYHFPTHLCPHYRLQPHNNRVHSIHHQVRHASSRSSPINRTILRMGDRPSSLSQSRRTSSRGYNSGSSLVTGSMRSITIARRDFGTTAKVCQSKLFSASSARVPSTTSTTSSIPRSTTSASNSLPASASTSPTPNANSLTASTLAQVAKYSDPNLIARMGRKRRHLAAMHRVRLQRQLKLMQRSQPQHSSQLLGLNGIPSAFTSRSSRFRGSRRKSRRRIGVTALPGQGGTEPAQYHHIHYYHDEGNVTRAQFLDIKDFLKHSRITSRPGRVATAKRMGNIRVKQIIEEQNKYSSIRRPFILRQRHILAHLRQVLEEGPRRLAIIDGILLSRGKQGGARLPVGEDLYRLVRVDQAHYARLKRKPVTSSLPPGAPPPAPLRNFNTQDYNVILARCEEGEDWRTGFHIARILLRRYRSPGFDFHSTDFGAPNTRTIHLLARMVTKRRSSEWAELLFSTLHQRYPHPIPLDVYTAYFNQLGTMGLVDQIELTMQHLETSGPRPTTTQYNALLKAIGDHRGRREAEDFFKTRMVGAGLTPDQQSYRILIDHSLNNLDLARAHYWLAEYSHQGFEVYPRLMERFMSACVRQVSNYASRRLGSKGVDNAAVSREWMLKAMNVLQFMSRQDICPTVKTFDLLIEGFLAQRNVAEALRVLSLMRSSPYFYTPNPRTWIGLFEYHLEQDEPLSALRTLNEMRRSSAGLKPGEIPIDTVVPPRLYRQLFRHYLSKSKLSMAERSLYEMLIRHRGARPNEQDVVDLIWKLDHHPEAAERVYELLYAQSGEWIDRDITKVRRNRIMEDGPIELANVGVMRAKANSKDRAVQDDVWKAWTSMMRYLDEDVSARDTPVGERYGVVIAPSERSVLALAFEQVAKAARQDSLFARGAKQGSQDTGKGAFRPADDNWDFSPMRQRSGMGGLGLGLRLGQSGVHGSGMSSSAELDRQGASADTPTKYLEFKGKHRMMIQQLLRHQEFLQPLLERRDMNVAQSVAPSKAESSRVFTKVEGRLDQLKGSFEWVQQHSIPIRIEGFNAYLEGLISHQDFKTARESLESFFADGSSRSQSSILASLRPNLTTVKILSDYKGVIGGNKAVNQAIEIGGPELAREWARHLVKSSRKRTSAANASPSTSTSSRAVAASASL